MQNLRQYYNNVIKYNLITKYNFNNIFKIPKIEKIILNIGFKNSAINKKKIIPIILLLKLIINQTVLLTKSKKNKIVFKIKKGTITGCKITLRNQNLYEFLEKFIIFILPNFKNPIKINKNNILTFQIKNILNFFELEKEFLKFQKIPPIDITIHTNNTKDYKKFLGLLNHFSLIN
jgi:large subunit ribosomal protein L5